MGEAWSFNRQEVTDVASTVTFAISSVDGLWLALDATRVLTVGQTASSGGQESDRSIDLARLLQRSPLAEADLRRSLLVAAEPQPFAVIAGVELRVQPVPRAALRSMPPFLEPLARTVGLMGLLQLQNGFAFILDLDALALRLPASEAQ